jgi:hypothetical protein
MEHECECTNKFIWCVWIYIWGIHLMRMSCCEITWGQDNENTSCVTCCPTLLYELVMITRLKQECEFMSMSIWCNVNLWVWKYNCNNPAFQAQNNSKCFVFLYIYLTHMVPEIGKPDPSHHQNTIYTIDISLKSESYINT